MGDRTIGRVFTPPDGRTYRRSMFVTLTLPSYGPVTTDGVPVDPARYDYRRAALDALHFPKLVDRVVQNLRRCAGYQFRTSPPSKPNAASPPPPRGGARCGPPPGDRC
jgi:hypothetical protein